MGDVKKLIAGAKLPTKAVEVCLRADLSAEYEHLDTRRAQAEQATTDDRLTGKSEARRIAEQMAALRQQMLDSTVEFTLQGLPRHRFRALVDAHPPRKDAEGRILDDDLPGINAATFYDALIKACVISPELDDEDWAGLLGRQTEHDGTCRLDDPATASDDCQCAEGVLTSMQFDRLSRAAWTLNRHDVNVPFSPAASRLLSNSASE